VCKELYAEKNLINSPELAKAARARYNKCWKPIEKKFVFTRRYIVCKLIVFFTMSKRKGATRFKMPLKKWGGAQDDTSKKAHLGLKNLNEHLRSLARRKPAYIRHGSPTLSNIAKFIQSTLYWNSKEKPDKLASVLASEIEMARLITARKLVDKVNLDDNGTCWLFAINPYPVSTRNNIGTSLGARIIDLKTALCLSANSWPIANIADYLENPKKSDQVPGRIWTLSGIDLFGEQINVTFLQSATHVYNTFANSTNIAAIRESETAKKAARDAAHKESIALTNSQLTRPYNNQSCNSIVVVCGDNNE